MTSPNMEGGSMDLTRENNCIVSKPCGSRSHASALYVRRNHEENGASCLALPCGLLAGSS